MQKFCVCLKNLVVYLQAHERSKQRTMNNIIESTVMFGTMMN